MFYTNWQRRQVCLEDRSIKERANPIQCGCKSVLIAQFQSQGSVPNHLSLSHIDIVNRRLNEEHFKRCKGVQGAQEAN